MVQLADGQRALGHQLRDHMAAQAGPQAGAPTGNPGNPVSNGWSAKSGSASKPSKPGFGNAASGSAAAKTSGDAAFRVPSGAGAPGGGTKWGSSTPAPGTSKTGSITAGGAANAGATSSNAPGGGTAGAGEGAQKQDASTAPAGPPKPSAAELETAKAKHAEMAAMMKSLPIDSFGRRRLEAQIDAVAKLGGVPLLQRAASIASISGGTPVPASPAAAAVTDGPATRGASVSATVTRRAVELKCQSRFTRRRFARRGVETPVLHTMPHVSPGLARNWSEPGSRVFDAPQSPGTLRRSRSTQSMGAPPYAQRRRLGRGSKRRSPRSKADDDSASQSSLSTAGSDNASRASAASFSSPARASHRRSERTGWGATAPVPAAPPTLAKAASDAGLRPGHHGDDARPHLGALSQRGAGGAASSSVSRDICRPPAIPPSEAGSVRILCSTQRGRGQHRWVQLPGSATVGELKSLCISRSDDPVLYALESEGRLLRERDRLDEVGLGDAGQVTVLRHDRSLPVLRSISSASVSSGRSEPTGVAPTLTRGGYRTVPAIQVLQQMATRELRAVVDFSVIRDGVGSITWPGPTDVTGVDLDKCVEISDGEVAVYESVPEQLRPAIGEQLNKRAVVCLVVAPEEVAGVDLEELSTDMGAKFVSYTRGRSEWRFEVPNFAS